VQEDAELKRDETHLEAILPHHSSLVVRQNKHEDLLFIKNHDDS
jgi:hypothetical protein